MWLFWWNRAPTTDNVIARGLIIPNGCCMCLMDVEIACHLFIFCPAAEGLRKFFLEGVGVSWVHPTSVRDLFGG